MSELLKKLRFSQKRQLPVVMQSEGAECGLACICMIANYHGHKIDLFTIRQKYPVSLKGANLRQLIGIAAQLKLAGRPVKVELEQLKQFNGPVILHWDLNHFVILKEANSKEVVIHDPGRGKCTLTWEEVSKRFTGIVLELRPTEGFEPQDEEIKLGFSVLWRSITGLKRSLAQILLLSLTIQVMALVAPYFIQLVVDNVVVTNDKHFLLVLGIGFTLLTLLQVATKMFRSWVILFLRTTMGIQLIANLFRHLLRLPMSWFGKRFTGDIISRFQSLDFIKRLLSEGFVEGAIDGLMAILTLVMMFIFSPMLALITVLAVVSYTVARVFLYPQIRNFTKETLQLKAVSDSLFYESVRSVQPVKIFSGESIRQAKLENANADWMNADIKVGRITIAIDTFKELLYGVEYVLLIWIGGMLVLDEQLTLGMLFAFLAYRQQFATSSQMLLEKIFDWRLMGLHLSRIADIALEEQEQALETEHPALHNVAGKIELRNISFQYNDNEPYLFKDLNLTIEAGECVVLTAPSGFGKTTLLKIIMGLMRPTQGTILLDGKDISQIGLNNYRDVTSAVMQGDNLLSGSIGENISFFAIEQDLELLEQAAKDAYIYDDIDAMPMGFHSLAGDMGSTLSGGQVQRVLIARALYKNPKVLFLDEASSALDVQTERNINRVLKNMGVTRIMIAHRRETIEMADRVIDLTRLAQGLDPEVEIDSEQTRKPSLVVVE